VIQLRTKLSRDQSNEPDRNRLIRRLPGVLWGDSNTQAGQQGGSTFTVSGGDGGPTHIAFATSFSQMMADARAARQKKAQEQNDLMMGLGVAPHASLKDEPLPVWNSGFDLWVEGHYSHFDDDQGNADRSGRLGVMYVGADYLVTPGLLIGALVEFDWMSDTSTVQQTSAEGHGWMAGPYMTARLRENLFFDARAAWGQSDNTVNPLGFFVDNFDTDRWLVRANLTGNWNYGNWRFTPSVSVAHIEEEQHAYIDALGISIPGQSVALGRVTFGPEVGYRFFAADGSAIEPMASLQGLWDFEKPDTLTIGDQIVSPDTFRGKVEAGVMFSMPQGATVRATGNYDGIGSSDFHAYGGQLWVNLPLH
jgi:outer membrane autotransporter protein